MISLAVRLGFLVLLLLPLIVIGWLWLRSQRSAVPPRRDQHPPAGRITGSMIDVNTARPASSPAPPDSRPAF